ncbi:acyl carrier protein [Streptomyces sp. KL116D]|uniref:acyl carrier protein n=1 Tax=Streptomyces sp. KL116D TaxID=3045152 RepID=UPI003556AE4B
MRERQIALTAAPARRRADTLAQIVRMLADVLLHQAEKIDPEQTFRTCGVDSLPPVEYVATLNLHYGTAIKPATLIDHPDTAGLRPVPGPRDGTVLRAARVVAPRSRHRCRPPLLAPETPRATGLRTRAARPRRAAARSVARICAATRGTSTPAENPSPVSASTPGWPPSSSPVINLVYGLRERDGVLYGTRTLTAPAAHIAACAAAGSADPVKSPWRRPGPPRRCRWRELLDAVRDGRMTA